jgi:hypothetical protein
VTSVATLNLGDGPHHQKLSDLHKLVKKGVTVIGLQEAGDRLPVLEAFLDSHLTWRLYRPPFPGAGSVPILYNAAQWQLLRTRSVLAVARRFVGPGAGPSTAKDKPINVVVLSHLDVGTKRFLNTHFIASATRLPRARFRRRRSHFEDHAAVLARLVRARVGRTVVMGDFNAEFDFSGLSVLRATGITGWTQQPTHGRRAIDHILGPVGKRRVVPTSSDHAAVVADL